MNPLRNYERQEMRRRELQKYYRQKGNLKLKYAALACAFTAIAIMIAMIFLMDIISLKGLHLLRGITGLCACLFVILTAILLYRVHTACHRVPTHPKH